MSVLWLNTTDPYLNLATEEVIFRNFVEEEDLFLLWISKPAFIVGRNQNPFLEIDPKYRKDIPVIRRISGGGTVYSDLGTLNYSYITKDFKSKVNQYRYFLEPIIETLHSYGVDVRFEPQSHLYIKNAKISGNAQAFQNDCLLQHGTLLFDTDLTVIQNALLDYHPDGLGHHIESNRSSVVNLKEYLPSRVDMESLKQAIFDTVRKRMNISSSKYVIGEHVQMEIMQLAKEKYRSWNWNYGKTQPFEQVLVLNQQEYLLTIDKGIIIETKPKLVRINGIKYQSKEYYEAIEKAPL